MTGTRIVNMSLARQNERRDRNLYGNFPWLKFSWLLQEKMCNSCIAVGCSNVSNSSKNVSVHKYNDSEKKRGRLLRLVRTRQAKRGNGLLLIHRLFRLSLVVQCRRECFSYDIPTYTARNGTYLAMLTMITVIFTLNIALI